jgi:putative ABC transport system permease protein
MSIATLRSFFQLIAVGYVLNYIFSGHGWLTVLAVAVMIGASSLTSGNRAKRVPWSGTIALAAIATATAATLGVLAVLQIIPTSARAVIPLGSMIITGAMNTTSLVMSRLRDDLAANRREIETRLSLAHTSKEAARPWLRTASAAACSPPSSQPRSSASSPCPEQ